MEDHFKNQQSKQGTEDHINRLTMDQHGRIHGVRNSAVLARQSRMLIVLGWICAALTVLVTAYFAVAGIILGVLANRQARGSGNIIIIANIVLAAISLFFGFFISAMVRMMLGY